MKMTIKFVYVYIFISKFGCLVTPGSTPGIKMAFNNKKLKMAEVFLHLKKERSLK